MAAEEQLLRDIAAEKKRVLEAALDDETRFYLAVLEDDEDEDEDEGFDYDELEEEEDEEDEDEELDQEQEQEQEEVPVSEEKGSNEGAEDSLEVSLLRRQIALLALRRAVIYLAKRALSLSEDMELG